MLLKANESTLPKDYKSFELAKLNKQVPFGYSKSFGMIEMTIFFKLSNNDFYVLIKLKFYSKD